MGLFNKKKVSANDNLEMRVRDYIRALPRGTKSTMQQILVEAFQEEIKDMDEIAIGMLTTDVMLELEQVHIYLDYGENTNITDPYHLPQNDEFTVTPF